MNRFEKEPAHAPHVPEIIRDQQGKATEKGQLLFKRSSDKNAPGNQSTITIKDLEAIRFRDTYGDRSGIVSWGFHGPLKMWIVHRISDNTELYKDCHDFNSWNRADLSELSQSPFSNPTNNQQASNFKNFLDDQLKKDFPSLDTAESVIKHYPDVIDPKTVHPLQVVMWPATNQVKQILVLQSYPDGSLSSMEYWVFDETTTSVVIKLKNGCIRLYDRRDLFQFRRWDIHHLSLH